MRGLPLLVLGLASALAGCRATAPASEGPPRLDGAARALDLEDLEDVERDLEPLFADEAPALDATSRLHAGWMLAQARALRSLQVFPRSPEERAECTALQVGGLYFARAAAAGEGAAREAEKDAGGQPGAGGLELLQAALLTQLGFEDRAAGFLDRLPAVGERESCADLVAGSGLHRRLEPLVWLAVFRDRARRAPGKAFPFAVATLEASDRLPGALAPEQVRSVETWIEAGAPFVFRCPDCGQPAIPQLRACPNDQTRLDRFVASPRP